VNITRKEVIDAAHKLNSKPRKCLGFATPYEAFSVEFNPDPFLLNIYPKIVGVFLEFQLVLSHNLLLLDK